MTNFLLNTVLTKFLNFSSISFFFFFFSNFLNSVLFSFLELIMFCRWLHAKGLLNQSLFSVYLKSLTSHSQQLNATKGPLTDKTIYYTSIRVTELIWKVKFCFHFYIRSCKMQSAEWHDLEVIIDEAFSLCPLRVDFLNRS